MTSCTSVVFSLTLSRIHSFSITSHPLTTSVLLSSVPNGMSSDSLDGVKWDDVKLPETMPRGHLEGINIAMLTLTAVIFIARIAIRITQRKPYELHDFFCHAAFVCYVAMWVMYWQENDPLWRAEGVQRGEIPVYPEICKWVS